MGACHEKSSLRMSFCDLTMLIETGTVASALAADWPALFWTIHHTKNLPNKHLPYQGGISLLKKIFPFTVMVVRDVHHVSVSVHVLSVLSLNPINMRLTDHTPDWRGYNALWYEHNNRDWMNSLSILSNYKSSGNIRCCLYLLWWPGNRKVYMYLEASPTLRVVRSIYQRYDFLLVFYGIYITYWWGC